MMSHLHNRQAHSDHDILESREEEVEDVHGESLGRAHCEECREPLDGVDDGQEPDLVEVLVHPARMNVKR